MGGVHPQNGGAGIAGTPGHHPEHAVTVLVVSGGGHSDAVRGFRDRPLGERSLRSGGLRCLIVRLSLPRHRSHDSLFT